MIKIEGRYQYKYALCISGIIFFLSVFALFISHRIRKLLFVYMKKIINFILFWKYLYQILSWKFDNSLIMLKMFDNRYEKGYRSINLLFRKYVMICNPDHIQKLLKDHENIDKSHLYVGFKDWIGDSILMRNGDSYKEKLKIVSPCFRSSVLNSFIPIIEENVRKHVETIKDKRDDVLILSLMRKCLIDIVYEIFLGIDENSSLKKINSYHAKLVTATGYPVINRATNFLLLFDTIFYLTRNGRKFKKNKEILRKLTKEIIQEKLRIRTKNVDEYDNTLSCLDMLLHSMDKNKEINIETIYEEVELLLFAGFDTVSLTVSWSLYLLGQHPDVQKRVKEELKSIFEEDTNRFITKEDLHEMKYLECVIKETTRIFPPIPFISRKINKSLSFGNKVFSKDWIFIVSIFHLHRNPLVFENPDSFIPHRFLPENSADRNPFAFIPFSGGPRMCLGHRLAMMEIKLILATILRNFSVESVDKKTNLFFRVSLNPSSPLRLRFNFNNNNNNIMPISSGKDE